MRKRVRAVRLEKMQRVYPSRPLPSPPLKGEGTGTIDWCLLLVILLPKLVHEVPQRLDAVFRHCVLDRRADAADGPVAL